MKIELTETEIIHIMDSLRLRVQDLRDGAAQWECGGFIDAETADLANELEELEHDLFEASTRRDDWTEDLEPTEIGEELFELSAEASMIQAGINARAEVKASSRAAERRRQAFGEFDVSKPDRQLSDQQLVDVWNPNDPTNW
jgi:hypothetical protein